MVKSFKGVEFHDESRHDKHVRDYMTTNLIKFTTEESIYHAMQTLLSHRISGAPVTDEKGHLCGVLSEGDCLKEIVKGRYDNSPNDTGTVGQHMTKDPLTIDPDMNILDAAQFFLDKKFRRFPVVKNGELVGLLTQADILKAVNDL